ncbi:MAG: HipA domain-containing protein, partial [Pseudomonadota bacterium]
SGRKSTYRPVQIPEASSVTRIHQEDFCQALGLPSRFKYERSGTVDRHFSAQNVVGMLRRTHAPDLNRRTFLRTTLFNLAIGNTDNHAKNHALIYDQGATPRLAPLYDMLPIRLYERFTHEIAFEIGEAEYFDQMATSDLHNFMHICGLRTPGAIRRYCENDLSPMLSTIDAVADELTSRGQKDFDDLIGRKIGRLSELLTLNLEIRERDYFAPKGEGWGAMS